MRISGRRPARHRRTSACWRVSPLTDARERSLARWWLIRPSLHRLRLRPVITVRPRHVRRVVQEAPMSETQTGFQAGFQTTDSQLHLTHRAASCAALRFPAERVQAVTGRRMRAGTAATRSPSSGRRSAVSRQLESPIDAVAPADLTPACWRGFAYYTGSEACSTGPPLVAVALQVLRRRLTRASADEARARATQTARG